MHFRSQISILALAIALQHEKHLLAVISVWNWGKVHNFDSLQHKMNSLNPRGQILTLTALAQHAYVSIRLNARNAMVAHIFDIIFYSKVIVKTFLPITSAFLDLLSLIH